jgi:RNA polymerase nonessential primary-like sigma factor
MPKSKRHEPQAESEKISRATQASVKRAGASTDDEEDVAETETGLDTREAEADGDDEREGRAEAAPTSTISAHCCRPNSRPTRSSTI